MCFQCLSGFKMQNSLPCVSRPSMNDLMSADDQCRGCRPRCELFSFGRWGWLRPICSFPVTQLCMRVLAHRQEVTFKAEWQKSTGQIKIPLKSQGKDSWSGINCPLVDTVWTKKIPWACDTKYFFNCGRVVSGIERRNVQMFLVNLYSCLIIHKTALSNVSRYSVYRWLVGLQFKWP